MPVLFLNKVISWSSCATAALAVHKLAQLVQIFGFDDAALDAVVKLRLFIDENLRLVADNDEAGSLDRLVVELLSRQKAVAANQAGDMHACFEPAALHDRIDGVRRGADDIAAADRFFRRGHGHDFDACLWLISRANFSRFSFVGLYTLTLVSGRTDRWAVTWVRACSPEPRSPRTLASLRARYLLATALVAPTRMVEM